MKSREEIKRNAKALIRTGSVSPLIVSAIMIFVQFLINKIVAWLEYGGLSLSEIIQQVLEGNAEYFVDSIVPLPAATFVSILTSLAMMVLSAGYYSYLMGISRGQTMPYSSLGDGLFIAGKVIWCQILMGIKIVLWSLLFWVPGIIAAYRYRFAIYNLIDHPELTASGAIALSCQQTRGLKGALFVLDITMLGWNLLSTVTFGLAGIWVFPYVTLCDLGYYEMGCATVGTAPEQQDHSDTPWEF